MAIIDILTPYDTKKKAAHAAKTVKHGVSGHPGMASTPAPGWGDPACFLPALPPSCWAALDPV